jgi:glycogen debranching enzyme
VSEPGPGGDFHIQAAPDAGAISRMVLKHEESFLVCDRHGDFPAFLEGELGFYHEGTRHLRWLELRLNGVRPLLLGAEIAADNDQISIALTNADLRVDDAAIPRNTLFVDRVLSLYDAHLLESLTFASFHDVPCALGVELIFNADFADVFEVRGMQRPRRGRVLAEERHDGNVRIRYQGVDGVERITEILFDPPPTLIATHRAVYELTLPPGGRARIRVTASARQAPAQPPRPVPHLEASLPKLRALATPLRTEAARIVSDNEGFNTLVSRSLVDLEMLLTVTPQGRVPYAGVPWYVAPFGRDALIVALQLLPFHAQVAAGTLRFLAAWQGRAVDDFLDEEPGRILHEYRRGEMANCREIPFIPYYGTVDATPLFLVLLGEYVRWTGDLALARELWPAARAALRWMVEYGDRDGDGYLEYQTRSPLGLRNQGWKDSEDAVMHADGSLARPPIALCEAQAYAHAAWVASAEVAESLGDPAEANALRDRARALREAFERDFWVPQESFYALALDGDKQPCEVIASNPGHCLWTGLVDEARAEAVAKRLMADDMFGGWGMRTLSARERRYNPMSYHNGSVWPHDNALAAQGFRRYRLLEPVITLASALFDASRHFEHQRMPELFCGFPRHRDQGPISYPVACAPQAWAATSVLGMLTALLGLDADAGRHRLTLDSPVLPAWLRWIEIHGLRVGSGRLDLSIVRGRDGASVELLSRQGNVELIVRR